MKTLLSKSSDQTKQLNILFTISFFLALFLRLWLGATSKGFETDISCFLAWSNRVYNLGFSEFYAPDIFTDYPPGYIYLLYPIGAVLHRFGLDGFSAAGLLLLKLPSLLCDMAAGLLIYYIGCREANQTAALLTSMLYLLNPAVLINSVVWGQTDSCLTLLVLLLCLFLTNKQLIPASFSFVTGLLLKPQMLIFAPLILYGIYEYLMDWHQKYISNSKASGSTCSKSGFMELFQTIAGGVSSLLFFLLAILPFGPEKVLPQYTDTLISYPYASVNACNIWGLFGLNWTSQENTFLYTPLTFVQIGTAAIIILTLLSAVIFEVLRRKGMKERYFLTGSFIMVTTFLCSVRMHERYLYPAMLLILITCLYCKKQNFLPAYGLVSFGHFVNVWFVLYHYDASSYFSGQHRTVIWLSAIVLACTFFYYKTLIQALKSPEGSNKDGAGKNRQALINNPLLCSNAFRFLQPKKPEASPRAAKLKGLDFALIAAVTLIYGIVAFTNQGYQASTDTSASSDYRSEAYFDEIYYFRTADEFLDGQPAYENTHPPLGKSLIAAGTFLFGRTPFGYRFMGTLFGVLMLPLLYLLARNLLNSPLLCSMVTLCFAFDFMHYTQTRIATIDVFIVFFIIAMYCFMERYLRLSFYDTDLKKTFLPLGACGIAFGLGISCKWTGFYAGAGLAILFFASLYRRFQEYRYAAEDPKGQSNGIEHSYILQCFETNTLKTIGFCMVFFVAIPLTIYILSYLPFRDYSQDGLLSRMWNNQFTMFNYHSKLEATHPYSSFWYEWPAMLRPVFYYAKNSGNGMYQGISAFGNPMVWYPAIPAAAYTIYLAFKEQNKTAVFLTVGFLAQFLPWILVTRCTFLYHYFPSVPFLVLMIGFAVGKLRPKIKPRSFYILCGIYTLAVLWMFFMFYPVITGTPVSGEYVDKFLRWMDSWVLILK